MKALLKRLLPHFAYFYGKLGNRIFVMLLMSLFVGLMDGLGLVMFLPLLEMVSDGSEAANGNAMGNFSFLLDAIRYFGLKLNLSVVLIVMVGFFVIKGGFKFIEVYLNVLYRNYMIRTLRIQLVNGLSEMQYEKFVDADAGRIQNTLSGEIERLTAGFQNYMNILQQSIMVLVYISLAFLSNPEFTLLVAIGGLLANLLFRFIFKKTKNLSRELTKVSHGFQGLLIQQVAFFKYLKATGMIYKYADKLKQRIIDIELANRKMGILGGIMAGLREPILIGIIAAVILVQVSFLGGGLGLIILSILFFYRALTSVMQIQTSYNYFLERSGSIENIKAFSSELATSTESSRKKPEVNYKGSFALKDLSFSYSNGIQVLRKVNLEIRKNETIAFVGESGSGKTTIVNLITGLLNPVEGSVVVEGKDLREINKAAFQQQIGYITQEPVIFDDTVYNNVTFWAQKTTENMERFWHSLENAKIDEFVRSLNDDENARLGNSGINLSGGQKQRISIARELYKDISILAMDEATSALDSETEHEIQLSIEALKGKLTIIIIAHRLSTVKFADRIILMRNGRIENIGPFDELMNHSASFKRMVELQEL